jgi:flagellar protein FlaF
MGFSISGSFAIIAFAVFVAAGVLVPTAINTVDDVSRAKQTAEDTRLLEQNTDIDITRAEWSTSLLDDQVIIEVDNTGSTVLNLNETDVLVDNKYYPREDRTGESVGGNTESGLWRPGETYSFSILRGLLDQIPPERVKIVTEYGVADSENVSG